MIPPGTGIDIEEEQMSEATMRRNKIADDMWRQYQEVLHERSLEESSEDSNEGSDTGSDDDFYV